MGKDSIHCKAEDAPKPVKLGRALCGMDSGVPPFWVDGVIPEFPTLTVPSQSTEVALVARRSRVEAFEVCPAFLMDTGSGHDIVSRERAGGFPDYTHKARHMNFVIANGEIDSQDTLLMKVGALGVSATPYVPIPRHCQ